MTHNESNNNSNSNNNNNNNDKSKLNSTELNGQNFLRSLTAPRSRLEVWMFVVVVVGAPQVALS